VDLGHGIFHVVSGKVRVDHAANVQGDQYSTSARDEMLAIVALVLGAQITSVVAATRTVMSPSSAPNFHLLTRTRKSARRKSCWIGTTMVPNAYGGFSFASATRES